MTSSFILYHYNPTLAGAIVFVLFFISITIIHSVRCICFRAWFMIPVVIGGVFEVIAYICRSISHNNPQSLGPYLTSSILSLVAPALFAATIYMTLGRMMRLLNANHHSIIGVDNLTKIFVLSDILSFQIQGAGAGLQAGKTINLQHTGQILVLAALFLQIVIFSFFLVVAMVFHRRLLNQPTQLSRSALPWQRHLASVYAASGLIYVRNLVRVVEYVQGYSGYIDSREWFLYVFDALPMFGVMVILTVVYAPSLVRQAGEIRDSRRSVQ